MLRIIILAVSAMTFLSCSEDSIEPSNEDQESTTPVEKSTKSTTLEEFNAQFTTVDKIPTLDLNGMEVSLVLNKESFVAIEEQNSIPSELVMDWILPYHKSSQEEVDSQNWKSIFSHESSYCIANLIDKDIKVYLLKLDPKSIENSELTHLGNISTFTYKDSSKEAGEEYDFDVTDCEDLILEIHGDTLLTKCMRYSATVGKDWRIDQNLYVNDTVRLPIIESSYSLY